LSCISKAAGCFQSLTKNCKHIQPPGNVRNTAASTAALGPLEHEQIVASDASRVSTVQADSSMADLHPGTGSNGTQIYPSQGPEPAYVAPETPIVAENRGLHTSETYHFSEHSMHASVISPMHPEATPSSKEAPLSALLAPNNSLPSDTSYGATTKPVFAVLPAHVVPTCPLDQILLGFFSSHRDMLSKGMLPEIVIGPQKASVKALVHTELATMVHPVSKVMSEVMATYPYVGKAEQLALFYLMHQTMRVVACSISIVSDIY
jgi:hypothetical protein